MAAGLPSFFDVCFFDTTVSPAVVASGYSLYTYITGTSTLKTSYTDAAGTVPNANPIILNSEGRCLLFLSDSTGDYAFELRTPGGALIERWDNVSTPAAIRADFSNTSDVTKGDALIGVKRTWANAQARTQHGVNEDTATIYDALPAGFVTSNDATTYIQAALNSGVKVVDFLGLPLKCDSVTVPAGVWAKNVSLTKYTNAAGDVVLVNTGCTITGKIAGTALTSAVQRCIYPAADGVADVKLNVEVSAATYGVHAQYLTTDTDANRPKRWSGYIYAHDIVGTVGASEGYGVLLSPANACALVVDAKTIARHALYLSAGARDCDITLTVDGCQNYAVQLFSSSAQAATMNNTIRIKAKNLTENVAGQGGVVAIVQKANYNLISADLEGANSTTFAINVEGASGGPYPRGNHLVDCHITGQFIGADVIRLLNADSTHVRRNTIYAYGTATIIALRRVGTNGIVHGGFVEGNDIDGQAQAVKGIYDEIITVPSYIGPNEIRNNGAALRVDDQTSGKRIGYSRRATFSGTTASIAATVSGDTTATLSDGIQTTNRSSVAVLTGSSVQFFDKPFWTGVTAAPSETQVTFRTYNGHSAAQTFTYIGWVEGD